MNQLPFHTLAHEQQFGTFGRPGISTNHHQSNNHHVRSATMDPRASYRQPIPNSSTMGVGSSSQPRPARSEESISAPIFQPMGPYVKSKRGSQVILITSRRRYRTCSSLHEENLKRARSAQTGDVSFCAIWSLSFYLSPLFLSVTTTFGLFLCFPWLKRHGQLVSLNFLSLI